MVKRLLILTVALVLFQLSEAFSQISIGTVDAGPYTPGSSIAATFTIGTTSCISPGNRFDLYLIRPNGTEVPTPIGSYNGFYSTFVNGTIPDNATAPPGTGYKLRIKSTNPASVSSNDSAPFEIRTGTPVNAQVDARRLNSSDPSAFGFCTPRATNAELFIENQSSTGGTVTALIKNELSLAQTSLSFGTPIQSFTPGLAHYTMLVKVVMPDGSVATKAYFIINNPTNITFRTTAAGLVCLPAGTLVYGVDTSNDGIGLNFPGNLYRVSWGDNLVDYYTLCQLKNGVPVEHRYTTSSCGRNYNDGSTTHYNVFGVNISMESPLCGAIGSPLSTFAKVIHITENRFFGPEFGCINTPYTFENNSVAGENPSSNTPECEDPDVRYNWYLDGVLVAANRFRHQPYIFPATQRPGLYTIRLTSTGGAACPSDAATRTICIQAPPRPAFNITSGTTGCAPFTVNVQDASILDLVCTPSSAYTYNWIVTDANGVEFTNFTDGIPNPQFNFTVPGVYTITLEISSGSCTAVRTTAPDPIVIINGPAVATLSPDRKLCTLRTYKFDNIPNTPTTTILTGTQVDLTDTYTWEVTKPNGDPLTNADYSFENGTGPHTKYPEINFKSNIAYKITVTHKNTCTPAGVSDSQILEFFPAPTINAGNDQNICFTQTTVQLAATNTGAILNPKWVGGTGTFSNISDPNATYTPSVGERNGGMPIVLNFTAETDLADPCSMVTDEVRITIKPEIRITSSPTKNICTNDRINYAPTSNIPGTTYTWTATGSANAGGYQDSATPGILIADQLTNSDPINNATVTYTIIPMNAGCNGLPFTLTVTITPRPVITATATKNPICSGEPASIALTSNLSNTKYTWTITATNGITGGTTNSTPAEVISINDALINASTTQGTVTYTITPYSAAGCPGTPVTITINVDPALTPPNAGADESICDLTTYTLKGNPINVGTGTWTLVSGQSGVTIADPNKENSGVNGLVAGQTYTFRWTVTAPGACSAIFDEVTIIVNEPTVPGTTAGTPTTVCAGTNTGTVTLSGHLGSVIRWESSPDGTTNTWTTLPGTNTGTSYIFNNLTANTYFRAIVQNGQCNSMPSTATMITVSPASTVAKAGPDQVLCNETTAILAGNTPANTGETGLWTIPPGAPSAAITDPTSPTSTVSNLIAGQTYRFVWTITGTGACGPTSDEVIITNNPPINQNISSTVNIVCNGQEVILNGSVPTGGNGTYTYQWESQVNTDPWRPQLSDGTDKDLVIILNTEGTVSFRRIVTSEGCTDTSNVWIINVRPAIKDNNITADQTICAGSAPQPLTGPIPIGGDGTFNYQWQSSPNGTVWTDISGANAIDYQPLTLTATTYFRRNASTAACGSLGIPSNTVKITVNPNARAEFNWTSDIGCFPFALPITVVEHPDRNATYTWFAGTTQIGTGPAFPGYTITGSNQSVTIRLAVTSSLGCTSNEMSHVFSTNQSVPASFNQNTTQGCGPLDVTFVNTSDLNAGARFRWNFGNGQTSNATNPPTIRFQPDASGKDTTYVVTLYSVTTCGTDSAKTNILVKSPPRPIFSPSTTNGCSPLTVNFSNNSPAQTGITYTFNFGDGTAPFETTDRSTVTHIYRTTTTVRTFNATLTAVNQCGTVTTTPYQIIVRPNTVNAQLVVNGPELIGCAPHTVTFDNNTTGATSYTVDFNDGSQPRVSIIAPERFQYTFTNPGTYKVLLTATNGCSTDTTSETIVVRAQPQTDFNAVNTLGCTGLAVKFTNNSTGAVSYSWNFGDGSPVSNEFEPTHIYTGTQEYYAVTLTTTNALGCSMTIIKNQFIRIVQPPVAAFNVNPSTLISIPDYTFNFQDESTNNPTIWEWDFGDGTTSSQRNPSHTYLDTGTYKVTLKTTNQQGCFTTTFKNVTIKGVPGYLFVPNAFTPGDTRPELREFRAKGSGILSWRFGVFNKWGQLLWETTKLEEGRPAEGWDGTFKGTAMPQGVYYWKIDVKMVNGSEWKGMTYDSSPPKRTGAIHLIR